MPERLGNARLNAGSFHHQMGALLTLNSQGLCLSRKKRRGGSCI